ncbi:MAG: helix-turn-helix domain-containing protein [Acidimicrobiales bacterium]
MGRHELLEALAPVAAAIGAELLAEGELAEGDVPLRWNGEVVGGMRLPDLNSALDRMVGAIERRFGRPLEGLSREDKAQVVRLLDERGAFMLRHSVERVAELLGVSRFTVYNYLNSNSTAP